MRPPNAFRKAKNWPKAPLIKAMQPILKIKPKLNIDDETQSLYWAFILLSSQNRGHIISLPIHKILARLLQGVENNQNIVLQAEPGAGKSTVVPLALLNADFLAGQRIIMLEPRRMAVRSIANYLARCLGERVGQTVGYQVKDEQKI